MRHHHLAILSACLLLAACGSNSSTPAQPPTGDETLPKPDAAAGSVTGMPNPGTPAVLPPPADNLATDNEDPDIANDDASMADPNQPVAPPPPPSPPLPPPPPPPKLEVSHGKLPADTMPVMPAHPPANPPANAEKLQVQTVPPPPQS